MISSMAHAAAVVEGASDEDTASLTVKAMYLWTCMGIGMGMGMGI